MTAEQGVIRWNTHECWQPVDFISQRKVAEIVQWNLTSPPGFTKLLTFCFTCFLSSYSCFYCCWTFSNLWILFFTGLSLWISVPWICFPKGFNPLGLFSLIWNASNNSWWKASLLWCFRFQDCPAPYHLSALQHSLSLSQTHFLHLSAACVAVRWR